MGKLYAIADLHLSYKHNVEALELLKPHPDDALILAGDLGESPEHMHIAFRKCSQQFKKLWWVPGNHELYSLPRRAAKEGREDGADDKREPELRGELKHRECLAIAREYGVLTPEDDFEVWEGEGGPALICPLFLLYDYSFRPADVTREGALDWARETGVEATDEFLLHTDPWTTKDDWCHHLVGRFEKKLKDAREKFPDMPTILVNHWPLSQRICMLPAIPRFSLWCGTKLTEDWGTKFGAKVVVSGHLHIRRTDWIDGVRYEECSLGYPRQWKEAEDQGNGINEIIREILPGPDAPSGGNAPTYWRRFR